MLQTIIMHGIAAVLMVLGALVMAASGMMFQEDGGHKKDSPLAVSLAAVLFMVAFTLQVLA